MKMTHILHFKTMKKAAGPHIPVEPWKTVEPKDCFCFMRGMKTYLKKKRRKMDLNYFHKTFTKAKIMIVPLQCHQVITFCPWIDSLSLFFGNFLCYPLPEAKSVFGCQMAKIKLDYRELGRGTWKCGNYFRREKKWDRDRNRPEISYCS